MKIAIIGGGLSGITTCNSLIDDIVSLGKQKDTGRKFHDFQITLFENKESLGGLWSQNNSLLKTNLSKYTCCFSDLPWSSVQEDTSLFPRQNEMARYLQEYAKRLNTSHVRIQLNSTVHQVSYNKELHKFIIEWSDNDIRKIELWDQCVITTGFFSKPKLPMMKQMISLKEKYIHSSEYSKKINQNASFINNTKSILIVGSSHSSVEIASDIAMRGANVIHVMSNDSYVLPRLLPVHPESCTSSFIPIDLLFYKLKSSHFNSLEDDSPQSIEEIFRDNKARIQTHQYLSTLLHRNIDDDLIGEDSKDIDFARSGINDEYENYKQSEFIRQVHGKFVDYDIESDSYIIKVKNSFDYMHIPSSDIELVVFCTGYEPLLEVLLDASILNTIEYDKTCSYQPIITYKDILHPDIPGLYFVGMYKGPYMATVELQGKLVSKYITKSFPIPSRKELIDGLETSRRIRNQFPCPQYPHSDYVGLTLDLAKILQLLPSNIFLSAHPILIPSYFNESRGSIVSLMENELIDFNEGKLMGIVIFERLSGRWFIQSSNTRDINTLIYFNKVQIDEIHCSYERSCEIENTLDFIYFPHSFITNKQNDLKFCYTGNDKVYDLEFTRDVNRNQWKSIVLFENSYRFTIGISFKAAFIDRIEITIQNAEKDLVTYCLRRSML